MASARGTGTASKKRAINRDHVSRGVVFAPCCGITNSRFSCNCRLCVGILSDSGRVPCCLSYAGEGRSLWKEYALLIRHDEDGGSCAGESLPQRTCCRISGPLVGRDACGTEGMAATGPMTGVRRRRNEV